MSNVDVNEIIRRLEKIAKHAVHCVGEPILVLSLDDGIALHEAAELLKEQEPMLVKYTTSTIRCPKCNKQITNRGALHNDINYCWKCGQAVKWE